MLIRDIKNLSEMIEVEELQKEIWGVDDCDNLSGPRNDSGN